MLDSIAGNSSGAVRAGKALGFLKVPREGASAKQGLDTLNTSLHGIPLNY